MLCTSNAFSRIGKLAPWSLLPWSPLVWSLMLWTIAMCSTWCYPWKVSQNFSWYKMWPREQYWAPKIIACDTSAAWSCIGVTVCFQIKFKVLIITFKTLHGITSVHPTWSGREFMLWASSVKRIPTGKVQEECLLRCCPLLFVTPPTPHPRQDRLLLSWPFKNI